MLSLFTQLIFGTPKYLGFGDGKSGNSWRDKSLRFDVKKADLEPCEAEQLIACFFPIEDVKGNQGELGLLKVTNLRLIWRCCGKKRVNLSIGWQTVSLVFEQTLKDPLGSPISSLCVMTKYESTKYEFIFNQMPTFSESVVNQNNYQFLDNLKKCSDDKTFNLTHLTPMYLADPFETVFKTLQCYKRSWLFRQCQANLAKLVSADGSVQGGQFEIEKLNWLPGEEMIDLFSCISQVESRSVKHVGTLVLTNIRLIWVDDSLPVRNLSIPYIRIASLKVKSSDRLVISTHDYLAASNQIELRSQKPSGSTRSSKSLSEQIQKLCNLYKSKPRYGPESCEDCLNLMYLLKPVELYFDSPAGELAAAFPVPLPGRTDTKGRTPRRGKEGEATLLEDASLERNEEELAAYDSKLNKYLDEALADQANDVAVVSVYGLAFERPANGLDVRRVWNLELP